MLPGSTVNNLEIGDRVTFSIISSCGECQFCSKDINLPQKCQLLRKCGHSWLGDEVHGWSGCYASHIVLTSKSVVLLIPSTIVSDSIASTVNCALATMVNVLSNIPKEKCFTKALIQGSGLLGLYGTALLHDRGFTKIVCSDISDSRLALVEGFGGVPVNITKEENILEDNSFDVVIEVCGQSTVVPEGIRCLRPGGIYIFVGMIHPKSPLNGLSGSQIVLKCLKIIGIHNYATIHIEEALEFLRCTYDKYPYNLLVSEPFALDQYEKAFELAHTSAYHRVTFKM